MNLPPPAFQGKLNEEFQSRYEQFPPPDRSLMLYDGVVYTFRSTTLRGLPSQWYILCSKEEEVPDGVDRMELVLQDDIVVKVHPDKGLEYAAIAHFGLTDEEAARLLPFITQSLKNIGWQSPEDRLGIKNVPGTIDCLGNDNSRSIDVEDISEAAAQLYSGSDYLTFQNTAGNILSFNRKEFLHIECIPQQPDQNPDV